MSEARSCNRCRAKLEEDEALLCAACTHAAPTEIEVERGNELDREQVHLLRLERESRPASPFAKRRGEPRRVDVLVFEGCPEVEATIEQARRAIAAARVEAEVRVFVVRSAEEAERLRFLGSPTVRVDGIDVDRSALGRRDFSLQCRLYPVGGKLGCVPPPEEWIASALGGG